MFLEILTFIAANKAVITGAVACVGEVAVIIHNLRKQWKAEATARAVHESAAIEQAAKDGRIFTESFEPKPAWRKVLWAANPINLFREP